MSVPYALCLRQGVDGLKLVEDMGAVKLRGAYYTSPLLVAACLERIATLTDANRSLRVLEPSAGDGAFARGFRDFVIRGQLRLPTLTCIELDEEEAAKCRDAMTCYGIAGQTIAGSFFAWADGNAERFDAVVGNPPFVRYQFVTAQDRTLAEQLLRAEGLVLQGVSNLWIPFALLSLRLLKPGGAFALVLPSELLTTISAGQIRLELSRHCADLQIDLYPRDAFPDILQDVVIVSGTYAPHAQTERTATFCEHASGGIQTWQHVVSASGESWMRYLLTAPEWEAFGRARRLAGFHPLKSVATIGVAIVTGANDFFTVDESVVEKFELWEWARPLLARTADSLGIVYNAADQEQARQQGRKCWLLDFSAPRPDPMLHPLAAQYLQTGVERNLPGRYKCRIRTPWYRVPHIKAGNLMLPKRSHQHHRLLLNQPRVFTTDTIYRGEMTPAFADRETDLVSGFHNSLTLLSAELEGRTYGGGVLELVPSELARLVVPVLNTRPYLERLDTISRQAGGQRDASNLLVTATDQLLGCMLPEYAELQPCLERARNRLRQRRFQGAGNYRFDKHLLKKGKTLMNNEAG